MNKKIALTFALILITLAMISDVYAIGITPGCIRKLNFQ
jgi:hypothetical protein